jgi:hypothetical protein
MGRDHDYLLARNFGGFAVLDALGECYAIRDTFHDATTARAQADEHLADALGSSHPRAASWVAERRPLRIESISADRARELREDGPLVLEREP